MNRSVQPIIIGAGPAGIRAAETLVKAGLHPLVLDEALRSGGQIYRRPLVDDGRSYKNRYGSEAIKAKALHESFANILPAIDYRPETLVWNISGEGQPCQLNILSGIGEDAIHQQLAYDRIILCTGATDRTLPFPGWTTPGIYTLGAAQTALKAQGVTIGNQLVFMGSGPLLYLVAWQYLKAGAKVAAVLDTAPFKSKFHLAALLPLAPRIVMLGLFYAAQLKLSGVKIHYDVRPDTIVGEGQIEAIRFHKNNSKTVHEVKCDAMAYGFALRSESQLADLAGCDFTFNARDRAWTPRRDLNCRSSRSGLYLAGDGCIIAGADAAEITGELSALALLEDSGHQIDIARREQLIRTYQAIIRQRERLEKAFPFPSNWFETVPDETILCRCEEIKLREAQAAIKQANVHEINRLKALSRVGMGRCQGRICAAAATEVLAANLHNQPDQVGRLRAQAPVKPIPLGFRTTQQHEDG